MKSPIRTFKEFQYSKDYMSVGVLSDVWRREEGMYNAADAYWLEAVKPLVEATQAFIDAQEAWNHETPRPADTGPSTISIEEALALFTE